MWHFLKNRRKRYLINPRFQLRFITYICAFSTLGILLFYFANLYFFYRIQREGQLLGLPPDHIYFQFIDEQKLILHMIFFITSLLVFSGIFISGLMLSHKIAGPLYHFCIYTRRLRRGEQLPELKFRKHDFFTEVASDFNQVVEYLRHPPTGTVEENVPPDEVPAIPKDERSYKKM